MPYRNNPRYNDYGRGRDMRALSDVRGRGPEFSDWDRDNPYGEALRDDFDRGDRSRWQSDDLGYGMPGAPFLASGRPRYDRDADYDRERRHGRGYGGREERGFLDKASDEVASWFGDEDAERRREMDEHRGKGPKGYKRTDSRILDDVNDRLADDGWLDASDIETSVQSGEVTLTGVVSHRRDKRRAEDLVEDISGVIHVQNNLRVRSAPTTTEPGPAARH